MSTIDRRYRKALREAQRMSRAELLRIVTEELVYRWAWERDTGATPAVRELPASRAVHSGDVTQDGLLGPGPEESSAKTQSGNVGRRNPAPRSLV